VEGEGVHADLALCDAALEVLVDELDGVLDGDDVCVAALVDAVEERGEGGGLSGAGGAGDEDEAALVVGESPDGLGE
jgi:hypothetical protein